MNEIKNRDVSDIIKKKKFLGNSLDILLKKKKKRCTHLGNYVLQLKKVCTRVKETEWGDFQKEELLKHMLQFSAKS